MKQSTFHVRRITLSAVFLSISLVLQTVFSFHIPLFGQNGMSIGISGIFSMMPAILFGPVYGAVTSGLSDLLGYILKPTGPYLPLMTLIVAVGGFLRGLIWKLLRNTDGKKTRMSVAVFSALMLVIGISNSVFLSMDGVNRDFYAKMPIDQIDTDGMHLISKMLITRTIGTKDPSANLEMYLIFMTAGVLGSAILGLILIIVDLIFSKKLSQEAKKGQIMPLLITLLISGLIVTTLNTILMQETLFESWKVLPFSVIWLPRAIEEIFGNSIKAYFIAILLGVFGRQKGLKDLIQ
ncbi:folate family ECF transporter S component [Scatolibacter rhodanostii]|uniref:folate family ECF transporter S component n=1 Tax=Scatolibacter rhodanostii TaxID=2014781 RepID=UPI000C0864FA|nr:folate family ECF transporter S component [Scatolibacter rhodanostii]